MTDRKITALPRNKHFSVIQNPYLEEDTEHGNSRGNSVPYNIPGGLFYDFLVATLDRALAFIKVYRIAEFIT